MTPLGKIHCPPNPTCPRKCHYKERVHEHGTKWVNSETCDECTCDDGTVSCVMKEVNRNTHFYNNNNNCYVKSYLIFYQESTLSSSFVDFK